MIPVDLKVHEVILVVFVKIIKNIVKENFRDISVFTIKVMNFVHRDEIEDRNKNIDQNIHNESEEVVNLRNEEGFVNFNIKVDFIVGDIDI